MFHKNMKSNRIRSRRGFRPLIESCEKRELLAITVTTTSNFGSGSLRDAIEQVNLGNVPDDTVLFDIDVQLPNAPASIFVDFPLPTITHRIIINGFSQPGSSPNTETFTDNAVLNVNILAGNSIGGFSGFVFAPGSEGSSISGLTINGFDRNAIEIATDEVHVFGNYIGLTRNGSIRSTQSNSLSGVAILGGGRNTIGGSTLAERNLISGSGTSGVTIDDGSNNVVTGNFLGIDATGGFVADPDGAQRPGNTQYGVSIIGGSNNRVGGASGTERNIISGNQLDGVRIQDGSGNSVVNNVIGLNSSGQTSLANVGNGVAIIDSTDTTIGGTGTGQGNVISANGEAGVLVGPTLVESRTLIAGNTIGLDLSGLSTRPNGTYGIIDQGINDTIGAGNLISGNTRDGIDLAGSGNLVIGSTIGLNSAGLAAPNGFNGIQARGANSTIGSSVSGSYNVLSANAQNGLAITGTGTVVRGNLIGLSNTGLAARPNQFDGILLSGALNTSILGGYVSGNRNQGIHLVNRSTNTLIQSTSVGLASDGSTAVGNGFNGILVEDSTGITIGGSTPASRNVVSGNRGNGILVQGDATVGSAVQIASNYIGIDATGAISLGNGANGIALLDADTGSTIGGASAGNWIGGNAAHGIYVAHLSEITNPASGLTITGNTLGIAPSLGGSVPNAGNGIWTIGVPSLAIGGSSDALRNVISNSGLNGILVQQSQTPTGGDTTTIAGNWIGVGSSGNGNHGNAANGIAVFGAQNLTIGGTSAARNIIANSGASGLHLDRGTTSSSGTWTVSHNVIGLEQSGAAAGNRSNGITLNRVSNVNLGPLNVISSNGANGIAVQGSSVNGTRIVGNSIGIGLDGVSNRGNAIHGIDIIEGTNTSIGGDGDAGNRIGFNGSAGVLLRQGSSGSVLSGNRIGVNADGTTAEPNQAQGVFILGSANNSLGALLASGQNVISGNKQSGIHVRGATATGNTIAGNKIGLTGNGLAILNNLDAGVWLEDAPGNLVGGTTTPSAPLNLFSGNGTAGVVLSGPGATNNRVLGNWFGLAADGTSLPAAGGVGVSLEDAVANTIGSPTGMNIISNQSGSTLTSVGVALQGAGTTRNVIQSNRIGTDVSGTSDRGNNYGVLIVDAPNNTVGGSTLELGNLISGNDIANLEIDGTGSSGTVVSMNIIGLAAGGLSALSNQHINDPNLIPSDPNRLTDPRSRVGLQIQNAPSVLITGNNITDDRVGVGLYGTQSRGTTLVNNQIGTGIDGRVLRAGQGGKTISNDVGVFVNDAQETVIGRPNQGNIISFNTSVGVQFFGVNSQRNLVQANTLNFNNFGVFIGGGSRNTIGGLSSAEGNSISNNRSSGALLSSSLTTLNSLFSNTFDRNADFGVVLLNTPRGSNTVPITGSGANIFSRNGSGRISVVNNLTPSARPALRLALKKR